MRGAELTDADRRLVGRARSVIEDHHDPAHHRVGCALRTTAGNVYEGVHLDAPIGQASAHAEPTAIANAIMAGDRELEAIVAMSGPHPNAPDSGYAVVAPCGVCRELIYEYGPEISVVVIEDGTLVKRPISALLPDVPWHEEWREG